MSMASNAAPRVAFQMTLFLILFLAMATLVVESAATGRAMLSANSTGTVEPTSKSQQLGSGIQWVQVTAVPLAVFVIGAYMWDIFKDGVHNRVQNRVQRTAASIIGTILNICRRLALTMKAVFHAPVENHLINNASNVGLDSAQEEGLGLPHSPIDATDLAATLNSLATEASAEMLPELSNVSNGEITEDVGASARTQVIGSRGFM